MRGRLAPMLLAGLLACADQPAADFPMPGRLVRALTAVEDLEAQASLTAQGGAALDAVPLTRGDDGVSFSGFLPAEPGTYTLEIVFTGVPMAGGARLFLGRWTSDSFTVTRGDAASPAFSAPLDVVGGPGDDGDIDADGLGNLDELLLGTDPGAPDSDGDGLDDGLDCEPTVREDTPYRVADGGSALDCDGDGARRPDVPFGEAGQDCDDREAAVRPGLEDDCSTPQDEDCNPATCPGSDTNPPRATTWTPAEQAEIGCHARFVAELEDEGRVVSAQVVLQGADAGRDATLFMTGDGDVFTSRPLNEVAGSDGLVPGDTTARLVAMDGAGNQLEQSRVYRLRFDRPRVTRMTPQQIGGAAAPFEITIEAEADLGLAAIELHRVAKSGQGYYDVTRAERVGAAATASPARFMVDPSSLPDGEHLFFPVARDVVGNEARPGTAVVPIPGLAGLEVDTDYRCIATPTNPKVPVRVLVAGTNTGYEPATMRDLLPAALSEAEATDPGTELVQIVAFGLEANGTVRLDDASSFSKRWLFGFRHPTTGRNVSVTWFTPAFPGPNPTVDPDAGNVSAETPFVDVAGLADSSAVTQALAMQGQCPALSGADDDQIIYTSQAGEDLVLVSSGGESWQADAGLPVTERVDCQ